MLLRIFNLLYLGIILTTTSITVSLAQDLDSGPAPEPLKIQRINSPVELDGIISEAAWNDIRSLPIVMRFPDFGSEPSEQTEILLGYDDDYLYLAGRLYDSEPSKMQATSFRRDGWEYNTDQLTLIIDAFNDNENAVVFSTTPVGIRTDVNILNDAEGAPLKNLNSSWNAFWDVATVQNDDGWFAEMRIPFSSLRYEVKDGQTVMGITAYRWIARKFELDIFPLIPRKDFFSRNARAILNSGLRVIIACSTAGASDCMRGKR